MAPDHSALLQKELATAFPPGPRSLGGMDDRAIILRLLWGYEPSDGRGDRKTSNQLVEWLDHDLLAVRSLAIDQIRELTGQTLHYRPECRRAIASGSKRTGNATSSGSRACCNNERMAASRRSAVPRADPVQPHGLRSSVCLLSAVLAWRKVEFRWRDLVGILLCMVFARRPRWRLTGRRRRIDAQNPRTAASFTGRPVERGRRNPLTDRLRGGIYRVDVTVSSESAAALLVGPRVWPSCAAIRTPSGGHAVAHYRPADRLDAFADRGLDRIDRRASPGRRSCWDWRSFSGWAASTYYACQDVDFDRSHRLSSVPARFGVPRPADRLLEPPAHGGMSSRPLVRPLTSALSFW